MILVTKAASEYDAHISMNSESDFEEGIKIENLLISIQRGTTGTSDQQPAPEPACHQLASE